MRIGNAEVCDDCGASYSDHAKGCSKTGPGPMAIKLDPKQVVQKHRQELADQFGEEEDTARTINMPFMHPLGHFNPDTSPDDDLL